MSDFQPVRCALPSLSDNGGLIVSEQGHPPVITGGVLVCVCACACLWRKVGGVTGKLTAMRCANERRLGWNDVIGNRGEGS